MKTVHSYSYLCSEFVTKLVLTSLLERRPRGLHLGHLDVLVFDSILASALLRIFVEFDTPTLSARETISRCESLLIGCASYIWLGYAISVRVRFVNNDLSGLFIRLEMRRILFELGPTATFCT
jgi:hypothetical protein